MDFMIISFWNLINLKENVKSQTLTLEISELEFLKEEMVKGKIDALEVAKK